MEGKRARVDQFARRVNAAARLLEEGLDVPEVTRRIARRYQLSGRQARRYVDNALEQGEIDVPKAKVVFTVKLPGDLVRRVRRFAKASGQTLSDLVAQALEDFLEKMRAGPRGGR